MKIWVVYEEDRGYGTTLVRAYSNEEKAKEFAEERGFFCEDVEVVDN